MIVLAALPVLASLLTLHMTEGRVISQNQHLPEESEEVTSFALASREETSRRNH
jgi:hypothetical protein